MVLSMDFKLIVFSISVLYVHAAELNGTCITPNGEKAKCIPFYSCPVIYKSTDEIFKHMSICAKDGEAPYICCGEVGIFLDDSIDTIFVDEDETIILKEIDSTDLNQTDCGIHASNERIVNGEYTAYDEFPWMVAIVYKNKQNEEASVECGGSLINKRFVLTSARCCLSYEFKPIEVRLGEWNLTSDPDCSECDPVQVVKISKIIVHGNYSSLNRNNDIALLRLEEDVEFTDFIHPICLPPENLPYPKEGSDLVVSGWGTTNEDIKSDIKLKARVPFVSNEKCQEALNNSDIHSNTICAGGVDGRDACQGDAGGPLMRWFFYAAESRIQWYQEGIVSYGADCGRVGYPGVYTKVREYVSWIVENIKNK
ncbi:hypothetical protein ILUMI_09228 [Ignelater luminosus]|uniref:CLIP domain-containing serine protease n=1 Tax=Ignelater luminosus TaxID=2038154 RepID=A0A8K0D059_IGNLU|nr:hypothetical protein ILUMI_09228 [Ignelater luminosus]